MLSTPYSLSITFLVKYEDLIAIPEKEFTRIIKYIEPDEEVDREHLKEVIKFMKIELKHKVTDFKYYESMKKTLMQCFHLICGQLQTRLKEHRIIRR